LKISISIWKKLKFKNQTKEIIEFVSWKENCPGEQFCLPTPAEKYCPGKKRIFEGGKENSLGNFFSTFLSLGWKNEVMTFTCRGPLRDRKVEKNFPREYFFSPLNILFSMDNIFHQGNYLFMIHIIS
jgi:hypothetical protein